MSRVWCSPNLSSLALTFRMLLRAIRKAPGRAPTAALRAAPRAALSSEAASADKSWRKPADVRMRITGLYAVFLIAQTSHQLSLNHVFYFNGILLLQFPAYDGWDKGIEDQFKNRAVSLSAGLSCSQNPPPHSASFGCILCNCWYTARVARSRNSLARPPLFSRRPAGGSRGRPPSTSGRASATAPSTWCGR